MKIDSLSQSVVSFADDDSTGKRVIENALPAYEQNDILGGLDERSPDINAGTDASDDELLGILDKVNQFAEAQQVGLRLKVDDDTRRIVVSMVDNGTGEVIRQIPSEFALKLSKEIDEAIQESSMPNPEQLFSLFSEEA
ncbi:flagellar protein FlaG [Oceanospirillum beijerinckii]|uniref:flagellar protein FlaG n=1 Tax=Oceanospirillum beijerinckii TaxID=64976 RepID=UPI0003FCEA9B|nr:flagellar protein FlaG [Oceanospirillum beijerinckii]